MSLFGWSYPPGAANDPFAPYNQEEGPCEGCGSAADDCICPECPACGSIGDPRCYDSIALGHFVRLLRSVDQWHGLALLEDLEREQAAANRAEGEYWADPQRKVEEQQFQALLQQEARERGE